MKDGAGARRLAAAFRGPARRALVLHVERKVAAALAARAALMGAQARAPEAARGAGEAASSRRGLAAQNADRMRAFVDALGRRREEEEREAREASARPGGEHQGPVCVICLQAMENEPAQGEEATALPCGHAFHRGCIDRWLKYCRRCPVDRKDVDAAG